MGNPNWNCPLILQIILLCLLQRLHRREIPTPPFYIFSKARKPLILLGLRRFCFLRKFIYSHKIYAILA